MRLHWRRRRSFIWLNAFETAPYY